MCLNWIEVAGDGLLAKVKLFKTPGPDDLGKFTSLTESLVSPVHGVIDLHTSTVRSHSETIIGKF